MADLDLQSPDPRPELVAVIMAGGTGSRFWPASTEERPKQFLSLFGERSLLQEAYDRLDGLVPPERVLVVTSAAFADMVRLQLPELPTDNVLGEPVRRDTAAAVTLAAQVAARRFGDPIMALFTADHVIGPRDCFQQAVLSAARGASAGDALYTFGIRPDHAATGYGYLALGEALGEDDGVPHHALERFVEKPDSTRAHEYVQGGRHLWNSGMFVWRAALILDELERQLPGHCRAIAPAVARDGEPDFAHALSLAFAELPKVSIDFGVMEHARAVRCVEAGFSWSDVGSFVSLADHLPMDDAGNTRHRGRVFSLDAYDNIVFSEDDDEVVAILGTSDLVVVRAGRRTLIAPRARAEEIKALVSSLDQDVR